MMKVAQLINDKGNPAANQFVFRDDKQVIFQSYNTIIAKVEGRQVYFTDGALNHSKTTTKHLRIFLKKYAGIDKTTKDLRKMLEDGTIKIYE